MVRFDHRGLAAQAGLHHIGVDRSLCKEVNGTDLLRLFLEDADEFFADDLSLRLGIGHARKLDVETMLRVHAHKIQIKVSVRPEDRLHLVTLVLAKKAVIDEDARQLIADGAGQKACRYRRIDAAREAEKHFAVADLCADIADRRLDEGVHFPRTVAAADAANEVVDHLRSLGRVKHFRMELNAVEVALFVLACCDRTILRMCHGSKARRHSTDVVEVAHPAYRRRRNARKERRIHIDLDVGSAVLLNACALHFAAEHLLHQLRSVAQSEHRNAEFEQLAGTRRCALLVAAVRTARQDDTLRVHRTHGVKRGAVRINLAVDIALADAARHELVVLSAEIDDQYFVHVYVLSYPVNLGSPKLL